MEWIPFVTLLVTWLGLELWVFPRLDRRDSSSSPVAPSARSRPPFE
jgi:hypothetical protein